MFLKSFYFGIVVDLQKPRKDNTQDLATLRLASPNVIHDSGACTSPKKLTGCNAQLQALLDFTGFPLMPFSVQDAT